MGIWLEALIRTGPISNIEARFIAKDERRVPILFSRTAMQDSDGAVTDIICIAKDMTGYVREAETQEDPGAGAERDAARDRTDSPGTF